MSSTTSRVVAYTTLIRLGMASVIKEISRVHILSSNSEFWISAAQNSKTTIVSSLDNWFIHSFGHFQRPMPPLDQSGWKPVRIATCALDQSVQLPFWNCKICCWTKVACIEFNGAPFSVGKKQTLGDEYFKQRTHLVCAFDYKAAGRWVARHTWVSAILPTPVSPTHISPTHYHSVPFRLLKQNVTKTVWNSWNKLYKFIK